MHGNYLSGSRDASHNNYKGAPTDRSPTAGHPPKLAVAGCPVALLPSSFNGARRRSAVAQLALRPPGSDNAGSVSAGGLAPRRSAGAIGQVDRSCNSSRAAQALCCADASALYRSCHFQPFGHSVELLRLLCPLLTSPPRSRALRPAQSGSPDTSEISRGKTDRLRRTPAGFTTPILDGRGLRDHQLARPIG
jgi:hypothetical protein